MSELAEGELRMRVPPGRTGRRFDDESHRLTHCMKCVDFIVELEDRVLFIEFKDPEHSRAPAENRRAFIADFESGALDETLVRKYRDSFLYEWAAKRTRKPIHYLVLIALSSLDAAMLLIRTEALKSRLPIHGPEGVWSRSFVDKCVVLNLEAWNRTFPKFKVTRTKV